MSILQLRILDRTSNLTIKPQLHPRNKHRNRYNLEKLAKSFPALSQFIIPNKFRNNSSTIDFFNPLAVKALNASLLKHFYQIENWDIPSNYLCPPIPGRVDYIHYSADLLRDKNQGIIPTGKQINCLDIGVGASCIYPILGNREYRWSFVGSDNNASSLESAQIIINTNLGLNGCISLRFQDHKANILENIIRNDEYFDLVICNPPFHTSSFEARAASLRKLNHLKPTKVSKATLNFGGLEHELWCPGGEGKFVSNMIEESKNYATFCFWFTTLVSKESNLSHIYRALKRVEALEVKTIEIGQGNKRSRIVAWTFLSTKQQDIWAHTRWGKKR